MVIYLFFFSGRHLIKRGFPTSDISLTISIKYRRRHIKHLRPMKTNIDRSIKLIHMLKLISVYILVILIVNIFFRILVWHEGK